MIKHEIKYNKEINTTDANFIVFLHKEIDIEKNSVEKWYKT